MRLELDLREQERPDETEPKVLRIVVSVRNLLIMLAKLDDPNSARRIQNTDVRCYTESRPEAWFWDESGWLLELVGEVGRRDRAYWWEANRQRRRVELHVTRSGIAALLGQTDESDEQPRDSKTSPFDRSAPLVICETDEVHYAQRPTGPGVMHPDHETKAQQLGAVPGQVDVRRLAWETYLRLSEEIGIHPDKGNDDE